MPMTKTFLKVQKKTLVKLNSKHGKRQYSTGKFPQTLTNNENVFARVLSSFFFFNILVRTLSTNITLVIFRIRSLKKTHLDNYFAENTRQILFNSEKFRQTNFSVVGKTNTSAFLVLQSLPQLAIFSSFILEK